MLAVLGLPGGMGEWMLILAFGLLLFGKRLPEVGRSLGKGIVEFKKGLKGVEDEIDEAADDRARMTHRTEPIEDSAAKAEEHEPVGSVLASMEKERPDPEELVERADPSRKRDGAASSQEEAPNSSVQILRLLCLREVGTRSARPEEPPDGAADHTSAGLLATGGHRSHHAPVATASDLSAEAGQLAPELEGGAVGGR